MPTQFDILKESFPYIRPLDVEFYLNEPYRSVPQRRVKLLILLGSMSNCPAFRDLPESEQNVMVKKVEAGCQSATWKKAKEDNIGCSWQTEIFVRRYHNMINEKATELDYLTNQDLIMDLIMHRRKAFSVGELTPEEADPKRHKALRDKIEARKNQTIHIKTSTLYECEQCNKKMCTLLPVQLRSQDEGKDLQCTCLYCGFEWLVRN